MKILKPIESIPTEIILKSIESGFGLFFCLGFFGGAMSFSLLFTKIINEDIKGIIVAISTTVMLLLLLFYSIYTRKKIIPELKKRLIEKNP